VVAARHAARNLQIDDAVTHPVAADGLAHHHRKRCCWHWHGNAQFTE
jgi:hypothetical protein